MPTRTTRRSAAPRTRVAPPRPSPEPPRVMEPVAPDAAPEAPPDPGDAPTTLPGYRGLRVWQKAMDLAAGTFALSASFPPAAQDALALPLRRAAAAVPAGIAEGNVRHSAREYTHYLAQALGTLAEVETLLQLAVRLDLATDERIAPLIGQCTEIGRMLRALNRSVQTGAPASASRTDRRRTAPAESELS